MFRPYNFSAGPAAMPMEVLKQAAQDMLDWNGSGMSVMEMSHRGKDFISICEKAEFDIRDLLSIPSHFKVLFMQGGGLAENAIIPMNLAQTGHIDFVVTGSWSKKSLIEAQKYAPYSQCIANAETNGFTSIPPLQDWKINTNADYVHICSNETIHGIEFHELPDLHQLGYEKPLVIDFSSHVASRKIDWSKVGLAFGGAQKNLGPAGLTLVVVREDLLGKASPICPSAFNYEIVAQHQSMYNTPPTWAIYIAGLTFAWLKNQKEGSLTGIDAIEHRNTIKANLLYDYIDKSSLYQNNVHPSCRSRMNVPFSLNDEKLNELFLLEAKEKGLVQLKGHKSVGGMRASIYNAMPLAGVQALVNHLQEFEQKHV